MREKMKKGLAYLLSSVLFVSTFITALPQLTITSHAEDTGKAIQLVTGGAADNIEGAQKSNVYFGTYLQSGKILDGFNQDPIKWRVLSNSDGKLFLLSDKNLDVVQYHTAFEGVTWEGSTIRSWLNGYGASANIQGEDYSSDNFIGTAFNNAEQSALLDVKVVNSNFTNGGNDTYDKVYLLSIGEVENTAYGYIDYNERRSVNTAYVVAGGKDGYMRYICNWWLRSPGTLMFDGNDHAACVDDDGFVLWEGETVNSDYITVRPALNINLESILFTSAAKDGKISGNVGADALKAVADYSGDDWKLTVEDSERDLFQARRLDSDEITAGGKVKIKYYGAFEGTNEYVSAIITDSAGTILYYGNIASCSSSTKGEAEINIPDSFAPGYKLYVFSEQCNGDYKTDYSSKLIDVTEPAKNYASINKVKGDVSYYIDGAQESNVYFGTYPQNLKEGSNEEYNIDPIKWRVLSNSNGKLFLLSDQNLDCKQYHTKSESVTWAGSTVRWWLNGYEGSPITEDDVNYASDNFIKTAFNDEEQEAIFEVKIVNNDNDIKNPPIPGGDDTNDKVFFLSLDEIIKPGYGFSSKSSATYEKSGRVSLNTVYAHNHGARIDNNGAGEFWLRSPGESASIAAYSNGLGIVHVEGKPVNNSQTAIRPALNINLESVLFTSAAVGGKSSVKVGSDALSTVNPITPADDVEWKFTVKDSERESFAAERLDSNKIAPGETVSIEYSGAITGENEFISAIITDSADNILYYGNIDKCDTSNNKGESVDIIIPKESNITSECKLYVFNEQCNGDYKTDFSSRLIDLSAPKKAPSENDFIVNTPSDPAFNGEPKEVTATVKEGITGMGAITVEYYDGEMKLDSAPSEPGTYNFKLNVGKGTEYKASIVESDDWSYTITMNAPAINIVNNATAWNIAGRQKHSVYFGTYPQSLKDGSEEEFNIEPIKWRVLSNKDGKLFLLSDQNLDIKYYNNGEAPVPWKASTIRSWLNGYDAGENQNGIDFSNDSFIWTAFTDKEYTTIYDTLVINEVNNNGIYSNNSTNDKIFLLSDTELKDVNNGFSDIIKMVERLSSNTAFVARLRKAYLSDDDNFNDVIIGDEGENDDWLLRPLDESEDFVSYVNYLGYIGSLRFEEIIDENDFTIRPALNVDLSSVLFTSPAKDGKSSNGTGKDALTPIGDYSGSDWKLTIYDSSRDDFAISSRFNGKTTSENELSFSYSNAFKAFTGENEFISAMLFDSSDNLLYYGRIVDLSDESAKASGEATITIPEKLNDGEYTLKFLFEQCNGDYMTDYASSFDDSRNITFTVGIGTPSLDDFVISTPEDPDTGKIVYDGKTKPVVVNLKDQVNGMGNVTVWYSGEDGQWSDEAPVNAGTYAFKLVIEDGVGYTGTTLTNSDWTFTIDKKTPVPEDFKINGTKDLVYDGNSKSISADVIEGLEGMGTISVVYYKDGKPITGEPKEAGDYTFTLNVGDTGKNFKGITDLSDSSFKFTIDKATPTPSDFEVIPPSDTVYDGTEKGVTVTGLSEGMGDKISVVYYDEENKKELTYPPKNKGSYIVKISINEGGNYNAANDLTSTSWNFSIGKATPKATDFTVDLPENPTYDGTPKEAFAKLSSNLDGIGAFEAEYYDNKGEKLDSAPIEPGEYTVKINVAKGTNYEKTVLDGGWKFTIATTDYEVKLVTNGGTVNKNDVNKYTYGTGAALPSADDIEKTGYTFLGWYDNASFNGNPVTEITSKDSGKKTYYAKWSANEYTVVFNANGGEGTMADQSRTYDDKTSLNANAFTFEGRTFNGWNTAKDGTGIPYADKEAANLSSTNEDTVTLYAQWTVNTFTVTWKNYDGSVLKTLNDVPYGSSVYFGEDAPTKPSTDDYTYEFDKWSPEEGVIKGATTYTATYTEKAIIKEKKTATVNDFVFTPPSDLTYDGNGKSATISKKEGTDNLIFKTEYYDDKGNKLTDGTFPSEPGTYYVKVKVFEDDDFKEDILENNEWKFVISPCDYAVTLIANGGTIKGEELTGYTYTVGAALPTADDIERTGYTFEGWYENADFGSEAVTAILPTDKGDKTFYAKWRIKTFTVTWVNYDGSVLKTLNDVPYGSAVYFGEDAPAKPSTDDYTYEFDKWSPEEGVIKGATTYTATYTEKAIIKEKKTATVNDFVFTPPSDLTYDGNGKSATVSKKEGTDNFIFKTEYYDDKGNKFTDGTFPSEPGTYFVKVKVFEDDDFKEGTLEDSEWKFVISPCDYAVSLIANGGTFKGNELTGYTYTVGAALPTADDIERTGYTFEGWYENADFGSEAVTAILPTDKGDKVYYAKWKIKTFAVTWVNYDGSILYTLNDVPYGSTVNYSGETPAKPSDDEFSYIFEAWSPEEGEITGDTAYTAVFAEKKNPYTITFDANGGSLDTETAITNDEYKLDTLPTPTLEGFNFKGWYTSAEDGIEVTTDTVFEEDTTVYALWEEIIEEEEPEKPKNTDYLDELYLRLAIAKELGGERTVTWDVGDSLPYDVLKIMDENPQITLIFTYTYLDVRYRVFISGRKTKANPNVPWAGPWYLLDAYKGKILTEDEE